MQLNPIVTETEMSIPGDLAICAHIYDVFLEYGNFLKISQNISQVRADD